MAAAPMLRRIFGRGLMDMALLAMAAFIFSDLRVPAKMFTDPDLWWHMACARLVEQTHHFIHVDTFSFTVTGQRWIDWEWLSSMFFWQAYKALGYVGVYAVTAVGICANVLLIYWRSRWKSGSAAVSFWVSIVAVLLMSVNASARTILFGYLALSVEMAILDCAERGRQRLVWLLPPLFALWINLHGSWIFGIAVLVLYIVCGWARVEKGIFAQQALTHEQRARFVWVLGASVAALLANPYGWRLMWSPLDMALNQKVSVGTISEWQPLSLGAYVGKVAVLVICGLIMVHAVKGRTWRLYELPLMFFAWYEAFAHARFTFLAAVLTLPIVAADVARVFFPPHAEQKTIPAMNGVIALGAVLVIAHFVSGEDQLSKAVAKELPMQTVRALKPEWRTLNVDDLGGLMDFEGKRTFVDTRWDAFEPYGVMQNFIDVMNLRNSLAVIDTYRIDHVFMREKEPLVYLLRHVGGWREVRREGEGDNPCVLLEKIAPAR